MEEFGGEEEEEEEEGFEGEVEVDERAAEGGVFFVLDCPHFTPLKEEARERAGEGVTEEGDPLNVVEGTWLGEHREEGSAAEGEPSIISSTLLPLPPPSPPRGELEADNERPPTPFPPPIIIKDPSSSSSSSSLYENGAPSSALGGVELTGSNPPKSKAIPLFNDEPTPASID